MSVKLVLNSNRLFLKSHSRIFFKIAVFKNFANLTEKICVGLSFTTLLKKAPTQVLSCEICEILKNTFFYRTPPMAVSLLPRHVFKTL